MTEFPVVLVINCGSSSIKFSVLDAASCDCLLNGFLRSFIILVCIRMS